MSYAPAFRPALEDEMGAKLEGRQHGGRSSPWCFEPGSELDRGYFERP
jgi:hypothetical protein